MKLHFKFVWERFVTAIKIDRIPSFDVRCWTFDVRCSLVSFIDQTGRPPEAGELRRPAAGLTPETRNLFLNLSPQSSVLTPSSSALRPPSSVLRPLKLDPINQ